MTLTLTRKEFKKFGRKAVGVLLAQGVALQVRQA